MASPTDIAGLINRWRADSIAVADGAAVPSWPALAGGAALEQTTAASQPTFRASVLNAKPAVQFTGTDDFMTAAVAANAQPLTLSFVAKLDTSGSQHQIFHGAGPEAMTDTANNWQAWGGSAVITSGTGAGVEWHVLTIAYNGTATEIYQDGTLVASGSAGTSGMGTAVRVGSNPDPNLGRWMVGHVAEMLVYSKALTAAERSTLHTYYAEHYGLTSSDSAVNHTRAVADAAGAVDAATAGLAHDRAGADTAGTSDLAGYAYGYGRVSADTAPAGDLAARTMQMQRGPADAARASDEATVEFLRADIDDFQFVLSEGPQAPGSWVPFGLGQTVVVESFSPGGADTRHQDVLSPTATVRWFGTDVQTPPVWEFELYTDVYTDRDALEWAEIMEEVWNPEEVFRTPNAAVPLRYRVAGRTRRVYGRPGGFTLVPTHLRTGRVHMVADFRLSENTYYDDVENVIRVNTVASDKAASGVTFPVAFPMTIGAQGDSPRVEQMVVQGRRKTWVDVTFYGPSIDPWIEIGGVRWGLRGTIPAGIENRVRMSGKPWQQGVQRVADGAWLAGMLGPQARLSQLRIPKGTYSVKYGAYDLTGNSYATVAWRTAHGTM